MNSTYQNAISTCTAFLHRFSLCLVHVMAGADPEFLNRGPKCAKAHSDRAGGVSMMD